MESNGLSQHAIARAHQLEHTPPGKLLLQYSIPATVATMVHATYNVVDRIFVGRAVGDEALAALTVSFPVMMIMIAFGMMFGRGTGSLMSISMGEERHDRAERLLGQGIVLFFMLGAVFLCLGLSFINPLLKMFGANETILPIAREYLSIILWGVFFHEISFGINSLIRSEGNIKVAMYTSIIGCGLNIVLDWVFLFKFKMGVQGAALATISSQAVSATWVALYYISGRSAIRLRVKSLRLHPKLVWRVIKLGSPSMLLTLTGCLMTAIMNNQLNSYGGHTAIAAAGVLFTVMTVIAMPLMGICQGAQPILGYNFGAAKYDRVRKTLRISLVWATLICLGGYIAAMSYPIAIVLPFTKANSDLARMAPEAIRKFMVLLPIVGVIFIGSSYFQSVNKPFKALILPLVRQLAFMPLLFILPPFFGLGGIWMCEPISAALSFALSVILLAHEQNYLKKCEILASQPSCA